MTSFESMFDFHDVMYHTELCYDGNRRRYVVKNVRKMCVSVQTRVAGNFNTLFKMAESLKALKYSFKIAIFLCVRSEINSHC